MDKFAKRLQSRLSAKGYRFTKEDCRQALACSSSTPLEPTEEEMILAFNRLVASVEISEETQAIAPIQTEAIIQDQEPAPEIEQPKSEESSLTVADNPSPITQAPVAEAGITQMEVAQAVNQAIAQLGATGNQDAVNILSSLAQELMAEISDIEQMTATLIKAYLTKRQNVLSSAIGTIESLRSAQSSSFQAGRTEDFFDQKNRNKRQFIDQIQATFN